MVCPATTLFDQRLMICNFGNCDNVTTSTTTTTTATTTTTTTTTTATSTLVTDESIVCDENGCLVER